MPGKRGVSQGKDGHFCVRMGWVCGAGVKRGRNRVGDKCMGMGTQLESKDIF